MSPEVETYIRTNVKARADHRLQAVEVLYHAGIMGIGGRADLRRSVMDMAADELATEGLEVRE